MRFVLGGELHSEFSKYLARSLENGYVLDVRCSPGYCSTGYWVCGDFAISHGKVAPSRSCYTLRFSSNCVCLIRWTLEVVLSWL